MKLSPPGSSPVPSSSGPQREAMLLRFVPLLAFGAAGVLLAIWLAVDLPGDGALEAAEAEPGSLPPAWFRRWWSAAGFLLISLPVSAVVIARSTRFIDVGTDDRGRVQRRAVNAPGARAALLSMALQSLSLLALLLLLALAADVF